MVGSLVALKESTVEKPTKRMMEYNGLKPRLQETRPPKRHGKKKSTGQSKKVFEDDFTSDSSQDLTGFTFNEIKKKKRRWRRAVRKVQLCRAF